MKTGERWPAWRYRHDGDCAGEGRIFAGPGDLEELVSKGEDWRDYQVGTSPPAKSPAPEVPSPETVLVYSWPELDAPRAGDVPPASELHGNNAEVCETIVRSTSTLGGLVQLARDEARHPNYAGGRRGVLEALGMQMVAMAITGIEPPAPPAEPAQDGAGEDKTTPIEEIA